MTNNILTIILACIGSSGLFAFLQFLITRHDKNSYEAINKRLDLFEHKMLIQERDNCRTQMLIMMNHYPAATMEIMKLAEHYFVDLEGDWYMTSLFHSWLISQDMHEPDWFNPRS